MSPLAKLLQIKPEKVFQQESIVKKIWMNFVGILRATKIQRRIRRLEIVERITLGNKQSVVLMRMDEREFMVGCCGDSVVLLAPPQSPEMPADVTKVQVKRQSRRRSVKAKAARPMLAVSARVVDEPLASQAVSVEATQRAPRVKPVPQIEAQLQQRVPTKARLVKAFAGRS